MSAKLWRIIYYIELAIYLAAFGFCFINNHKMLALPVVFPIGWIISAILWRKKNSN